MSAVDLPPGIGLTGTPLGTFRAPTRARRLASLALLSVIVLGAITWIFVLERPWYRRWYGGSTQIVLTFALLSIALLGFAVRRARMSVSRDGVRWGWDALGFTNERSRMQTVDVYSDGVAFHGKRGSTWFIAARDWERFDAFVRQLRRAELPVRELAGKAPLRARLQSYGRFLDVLLVLSVVAALGVVLWAA